MIPEAHPDFSCPSCGQTFIVTGDTDIARARALRDWRGCCIETTPDRAEGEAVRSGAPRPGLLSGVPRWVRRRMAAIDPGFGPSRTGHP